MSVKVPPSSPECQELRLRLKTLGQQMQQIAVHGAGLSPWEAVVLVKAIDEVYFSDPELKSLSTGQMKYSCVAASEGAGKPLKDCSMTTVRLTLLDPEDRIDLPSEGKLASVHRRRRKLVRIAEEAREQRGYLSQEDLAMLLTADVRTIRRDIRALREEDGIVVPTRGQQKDIGPGVTHRGQAIRHWLEGKEPVEVARAINHSIGSVENYLEKFKRVAYLRGKHFDDFQIALTTGISVAAAKTFVAIYEESKSRPFFASRMAEIDLVGEQHYLAADEKKDSALSSSFSSAGRNR